MLLFFLLYLYSLSSSCSSLPFFLFSVSAGEEQLVDERQIIKASRLYRWLIIIPLVKNGYLTDKYKLEEI